MRVCVVTPYYKESQATLERCLESVKAQTYPCEHVLVSDGFAQSFIDGMPVQHVKLGVAHGDYGDTPRAIGTMIASSRGFDAVTFLDADNTYLPNHVETLAQAAVQQDADIVTCRRFLVTPDMRTLAVPDDRDEGQTRFCDTNCYFITRAGFAHIQRLQMKPRELSVIGDQILWQSFLAAGMRIHRLADKTVNYFTLWRDHYRMGGLTPPPEAKTLTTELDELKRWWVALGAQGQRRVCETLGFAPAIH